MSTRQEVYAAIDSERDYQNAMAKAAHGDPSNDGKKQLETFVLYMDDYMTELKNQLSRHWGPGAYDKPLNTMRKILAIGVSAMEVHGAPKRTAPTKHAEGVDLTKPKCVCGFEHQKHNIDEKGRLLCPVQIKKDFVSESEIEEPAAEYTPKC